MISVGETFSIDGQKWVIKMIDLDGSNPLNKSGEARIDASKLVKNELGEERVKRGRPSKFKPAVVFEAMGQEVPRELDAKPGFAPIVQVPTTPQDNEEEEWERLRERRERISSLIDSLPGDDW